MKHKHFYEVRHWCFNRPLFAWLTFAQAMGYERPSEPVEIWEDRDGEMIPHTVGWDNIEIVREA